VNPTDAVLLGSSVLAAAGLPGVLFAVGIVLAGVGLAVWISRAPTSRKASALLRSEERRRQEALDDEERAAAALYRGRGR